MQPSERLHLSVGLAAPLKLLFTALALVFLGGSGFFMAFAFMAGEVSASAGNFADQPIMGGGPFDDPFFSDAPMPNTEPFEQMSSFMTLMARAIGLCGIPLILVGLYLLLHVWRRAAWLDGMLLTMRGAFLSRTVDLSTAEISMAGVNYAQNHQGVREYRTTVRVPALAATDQRSGQVTKLPLRGQGLDLLPSFQLVALADALDQNRSTAAERARSIGAHLRSLAADPLSY